MAESTEIVWCDSTFNPWDGCTKVGPGCDHCYAERRNARFGGGVASNWGPGAPRRHTSIENWGNPAKWNSQAEAFAAVHGRRQRVFCASIADVFDNEVDPAWRADLFALIAATQNLDWLLLTKRIGNAPLMIADALPQFAECGAWPWPNVWLGATVVSQEEADRDIPKLLATPAAVRFLSIEPMLGPINLGAALLECCGNTEYVDMGCYGSRPECCGEPNTRDLLDWVIAGGESGPGARPMLPDWVRSLRDQCAAAGVPFLFKQWGEWTPGENVERVRGTVDTAILCDDGWHVYPLNLATDEGHIDDQPDLYRVGKKAAGRLLDGAQHDGFPRDAQWSEKP